MELLISAIVSALVQIVKKYTGTNQYATLGVLAVCSLAAAGVYVTVKETSYWPTLYAIIVQATAIYALIIQRFESQ